MVNVRLLKIRLAIMLDWVGEAEYCRLWQNLTVGRAFAKVGAIEDSWRPSKEPPGKEQIRGPHTSHGSSPCQRQC